MNYNLLKSILAARKKSLVVRNSSPSFLIAEAGARPYIEPTFEKVIFETEKPTIILVSAVGATGKTALALQLSSDLQLPVLDLAKHKPVGDNTLTGLLTSAFEVGDISTVFAGLTTGEYGVIIDGIDEGRSKTTEKAFEAFLDDVAKLCKPDSPTTFLLLGRTQILDACWDYLSGKGASTALVTISPFSVGEARKYIDTFTVGPRNAATYAAARDGLLETLSRVFAERGSAKADEFLSFIGYPPVLDAIVTLLSEEQNYHKLLQGLGAPQGQKVEVSLLKRITQYIMERERDQKVIPNILAPILDGAPDAVRQRALADAFSVDEQSVRLVAHCLDRQLALGRLREPVLDEQYEEQLTTWLPGHPFLSGRQFRNAVFEAFALATLVVSNKPGHLDLLDEYVRSHKHSYHLIYMLDVISQDRTVPLEALGPIFTAAMEFRSVRSIVELRVDGPEWDDGATDQMTKGELEIEIGIILGGEKAEAQTFAFRADIGADSVLKLGARLGNAFVTVPCTVELGGTQELELTAPIDITAASLSLAAKALILHSTHNKDAVKQIVLDAGRLSTSLETITTNGVPLIVALRDTNGVFYPVIQYAQKVARPPADPLFQQKYFRLKRILLEFRSHSRGALARYKGKIESQRVLKNSAGEAVLARLVRDGVLILRDNFYFLDQDKLGAIVGVSWQDLRTGAIPESLEKYIRTIA